jgi:hypothetical protein
VTKNPVHKRKFIQPMEAARTLGVSYPFFANALQAGDVNAIVFGGKTYITHAEMKRLEQLFQEMGGELLEKYTRDTKGD